MNKFIVLGALALIQGIDAFKLPSLNPLSYIRKTIVATQTPVCYNQSGLGCFSPFPSSKDFHVSRIGLMPLAPEKIDVTFRVYTCKKRHRAVVLSWNMTEKEVSTIMKREEYDSKMRTVFIVHGFRDSYEEYNWMGDMKDYILNTQNRMAGRCAHNVITVDWRGGSQTPLYPQAVADTMMVGRVIAKLIKSLMKVHSQTEDAFTLVGHSLGSHICGFAGKEFKTKKLHNIIGLDPAGPFFHDTVNHRLSPNDANLVLTIHTNGKDSIGGFGINIPLGHYSFFPNGGAEQPGCESKFAAIKVLMSPDIKTGLSDSVACSHRRACLLVQFNETMLTESESMAYACESYEKFQRGECGECNNQQQCQPFFSFFNLWQERPLDPTWTKPRIYYIDTTDLIPYSTYHYHVTVHTGDFTPEFKGSISLLIRGEERDSKPYTISSPDGIIRPNKVYKVLVKAAKLLGPIVSAAAMLEDAPSKVYSTGQIAKEQRITLRKVDINFMSAFSPAVRAEKSRILTKMPEYICNKVFYTLHI